VTKVYQTVLKERRRCQKSASKIGRVSTTICAGSDPRGKIARAYFDGSARISTACTGVNLLAIDGCSSASASSLASCSLDAAEAQATIVFESSYGLPPGEVETTTTTTTTTTTSTTLGPQDPNCPEYGEVMVLSSARGSCATNAECEAGTCDPTLHRCRTATELDTGWTGISHDADVTDGLTVRAKLRCEGPFDSGSPEPCGECKVIGLDPSERNCRCANDTHVICDEPLKADADDCGGNMCECYLGPPLALSAGNTFVCVLNKYRSDVSGTANVDTGEGIAKNSLSSIVFLGEALTKPCPVCVGDPVAADGVRGGTCSGGIDNTDPCDVDAVNTTFPAPSGGGHSLDCQPDPASNISGTGLKIDLNQTTAAAPAITASLPCFFNSYVCHCMVCSNDIAQGCTNNADCTGGGICDRYLPGANPRQNGCDGDPPICNPTGNGEGECAVGPDTKFCDGVSRSNGEGYVSCNSNADCASSGCGPVSCGSCTQTERRECFLETIEAQGTPDPEYPIGVATFCLPPTANGGVNATAGLPGPGRLINQQKTRVFCASNPAVEYQSGIGGCP